MEDVEDVLTTRRRDHHSVSPQETAILDAELILSAGIGKEVIFSYCRPSLQYKVENFRDDRISRGLTLDLRCRHWR